MRLWHEALLPYLPRQQILGQHRECAALRGNGWGKKHATVDYVFTHPMGWLIAYHKLVMNEMIRRGYHVADEWHDSQYRGKQLGYETSWASTYESGIRLSERGLNKIPFIYPEHNDAYLRECLDNLKEKGITISLEMVK